MTTRRDILVYAASAVATSFSQLGLAQGKMRRRVVGFLQEGHSIANLDGFKVGMRELGYGEGKDYVIEWRAARGDLSRLPDLVAELIKFKVDVIVATGTPSALAARTATREIPILIATLGDPVGSGVVTSLRRPGGNVTGLTSLSTDLMSKRLDLLRQIVPDLRRVGFIYNPDSPIEALSLRRFESDCDKLNVKAIAGPLRKPEDAPTTFGSVEESAGARDRPHFRDEQPLAGRNRPARGQVSSAGPWPHRADTRRVAV